MYTSYRPAFGLACFLAVSGCSTSPDKLVFGPDTPKGLALIETDNLPTDDMWFGYLKFDPASRVPATTSVDWLKPTVIRTPKVHVAYFGVMDPGMYVLAETRQFGDHIIISACLSKGTVVFEIKPGQVSYVGQFRILAAATTLPMSLQSAEVISEGSIAQLPDDLRAAEADLAAMKMITAPLKAAIRTQVQYDA
ncbi:MAG TPA: hypothetical protein VK479_16060, partial [Micropepsaceae bacterium]|nr:hypothetical protein [Micropepsaceae bacterium]